MYEEVNEGGAAGRLWQKQERWKITGCLNGHSKELIEFFEGSTIGPSQN